MEREWSNMRYRKRPVVVDAFVTDEPMEIETLEGTMHASPGDYVITGVKGERYPCKPDIFKRTYEPVDEKEKCDASQGSCDTVASDPTERGIDSIYDWCFAAIEGADGAEDELYCSIMRAIEDYRHTERATAHTVQTFDRDALMALADEMTVEKGDIWGWGRRIREALGVQDGN